MPTLEHQIRAAFERVAAQTVVDPAPSFKMLDSVRVQPGEQEPATLDLDAPDDAGRPRPRSKRLLVAALLAAATVAAIGLVAIRKDEPVSPADQPSPDVTAPSTVTVTPTAPQRSIGNPLVDIQTRLVDGDVELFRMTSNTEHYWRLTTLPEFDGDTFGLPRGRLGQIDGGGRDESGPTIRQQIEIVSLEGNLLPAAANPFNVSPNSDIRLNPDTDTLVKLGALQPGDQYTIVSVTPDPSPEQLRAATTDNPPDQIFVTLPDNLPDVIAELAAEVTTGAATDFDRMIALRDWFRSTFAYDATIEAGHSSSAIATFLDERRGYCEQFAATMAVMARTLGIPSRVAVGFTPGALQPDGSYAVSGRNSHAWPEIWFDGIGWIQFEPTPSRGIPVGEVSADVPATGPQPATSTNP
jgi:hypothetical protein